MKWVLAIIVTVLIIAAGCSGVQSQSGTEQTPTQSLDTTSTETDASNGFKPEAMVDINLEWVEGPQGVDSTGTLEITLQAKRTLADETLHIAVPEGVELVSGEREQSLDLADGESMTTTVSVKPTTSGEHQIHVYTSNLVSGENGTVRASELITFETSVDGDESTREEATSASPPTSENATVTAL